MTANAPNRADRPIFIGGLMKSGTSLLRVLVGQHPDVFASFETHWFDPAIRENWDDRTSRRMVYLCEFFEIDDETYARLVAQKRAEPAREFIDIVLCDAAARAGKLRWAEKTPANIRHWPLIKSLWPDARLVHVTREYRDCFASWKERRGDSLDDFLQSARTAYDAISPLLGSSTDDYMEVDYTELVRDTENAMRKVLEFAELPWDARCAAIDTDATTRERATVKTVTGRDSKTSVSLARPIFDSSVGQWPDLITPEEADTVRRELAPWYARLGHGWDDA
ncbi:MAG: sulfotransferase [Alphaproteobacteria bacterium]|nr:sulfotransferase [Alphaproteobacteria bacterium]